MNFREKFTAQIVICLMIFSAVKTVGMVDLEPVRNIRTWVQNMINTDYSVDEISQTASEWLKEAGTARDTLTSAVIQANETGQFGQPMGEGDENGVHVIYAPAGGQIIEAGISDELGMYVKIRHDEKISVCGNLASLAVITGERVGKGDIIGTFSSNTGKEFYYELQDIENLMNL